MMAARRPGFRTPAGPQPRIGLSTRSGRVPAGPPPRLQVTGPPGYDPATLDAPTPVAGGADVPADVALRRD